MGHKLMLDLPDEVYEFLTRTAKETGQSPDAVATQLLASLTQQAAEDPLEEFIGAFDSRGSGWVDRHDEHLSRAMIETSRPE